MTPRPPAPDRLADALARRVRQVAATGDTGSATAELVLLTPLLVMILLFVVLCGRLTSAQLDVDAAASAAARAASLARTNPTARTAAEHTALDTLASRGVTCQDATITMTGTLTPGSAITIRVSCQVPLTDLTLLTVPGHRHVEAEATSPIDQWRGSPP